MNLAKYIDAMIPGTVGILLLVAPDILLGKSITGDSRQQKLKTLRRCGGGLIGIAVLYAVIAACR
jgi:uncharacterized protein YjeT (DUF2065 family)